MFTFATINLPTTLLVMGIAFGITWGFLLLRSYLCKKLGGCSEALNTIRIVKNANGRYKVQNLIQLSSGGTLWSNGISLSAGYSTLQEAHRQLTLTQDWLDRCENRELVEARENIVDRVEKGITPEQRHKRHTSDRKQLNIISEVLRIDIK